MILNWRQFGWSGIDHTLVAGSNFIFTILLARWLSSYDFGLLSMTLSLYVLLLGLQNALLLEPLTVLGPKRFQKRWTRYLRVLSRGYWRITLLVASAAIGLLIALDPNGLTGLILLFLACTPLVFYQTFARRVCYLERDPSRAARGGLFYAAALLLLALLGSKLDLVSPSFALVAMSAASYASGCVMWRGRGKDEGPQVGSVWCEHWSYGRWVLASAAANWFVLPVYIPLLGLLAGAAEAGGLRVTQVFLLPLLHFLASVSMILLPEMSRREEQRSEVDLSYVIGQLALALLYGLGLILAGPWLLGWLFAGRYEDLSWLVGVFAFAGVLLALIQTLQLELQSRRRSDLVVLGQAAGAIFTLAGGVPLVLALGISGAALGLLGSLGLQAAALLVCFLQHRNRRRRIRKSLQVSVPSGHPEHATR